MSDDEDDYYDDDEFFWIDEGPVAEAVSSINYLVYFYPADQSWRLGRMIWLNTPCIHLFG